MALVHIFEEQASVLHGVVEHSVQVFHGVYREGWRELDRGGLGVYLGVLAVNVDDGVSAAVNVGEDGAEFMGHTFENLFDGVPNPVLDGVALLRAEGQDVGPEFLDVHVALLIFVFAGLSADAQDEVPV